MSLRVSDRPSLGHELRQVDVHDLLVVQLTDLVGELLLQLVAGLGLGQLVDVAAAVELDDRVEGLAAVGLRRSLDQLQGDADAEVVAVGEVDLDRVERQDLAGLGGRLGTACLLYTSDAADE